MNKPTSLSILFEEQIQKAVSSAVQKYLSKTPEEKQQMETQGVNLYSFIHAELYPLIFNLKVKRLLLVMEEGIGNMVMMTPALKMLRYLNPRLHITVWCKKPANQVIEGWDIIDNVITDFNNEYYDLCIFTIWSNATKQIYGQILQRYCKGQFDIRFKPIHEAIQHLSIVEFFDGYSDLCLPYCQVATNTKEIEQVDNFLAAHNLTEENKYIVFGDTTLRNYGWERKKWPYYTELAELIKRKFPELKIILIGDYEDKKEQEAKNWPDNVIFDFMGKFNIRQLAYLLKHKNCSFYLGNDSGPSHIAAAVGTKTYVIFGPTRESKNLPLGKNVTILNRNIWCSPCQYTERWEKCSDWVCLSEFSAHDVYNKIFFPESSSNKKKILLVGDFSPGALRNEIYIKQVLENKFKFKVIPIEYRNIQKKYNNNYIDATFEVLEEVIKHKPECLLICGGQGLIPQILNYVNFFTPKVKIINWYVDNRGKVEPWFYELCSICHTSYWSTGDPHLLSQVFSQTQKPCEFLPITPDSNSFYPIDGIEKIYDVVFIGTPHSEERIKLLRHLIQSGVKIKIFGNGQWPEDIMPYVSPGIFNRDLNATLNAAKIVINQNIINTVPFYFSDRYFYPMAVKSVGLNQYIPKLEEMFEDGTHMVFFKTPEECVEKINLLLQDNKLRAVIEEEGYKLYKTKYTLDNILNQIIEDNKL